MTHSELVILAKKWLLRNKSSVVITELVSYNLSGEVPDAVGWDSCISTLIECKTSLQDFRADQKKPARRTPSMGIGNFRYYMAPSGMIKEVPQGWGLLEVYENGSICRTIKSSFFECSHSSEVSLLISAIRRFPSGDGKVKIKFYPNITEGQSTITTNFDADIEEEIESFRVL